MTANNIMSGSFTDLKRKELFETLGLAAYLNTNICYRSAYPYQPSTNGWNSGEHPIISGDESKSYMKH